jgi:hypothetical protein
VWNRWDARWYDDLARLGYNLHGPNDYKNVAFFPLYPLLVRMLHDGLALMGRDVRGLTPKDPFYPPYLVPGMIVANLCTVAALSFFYGYVRLASWLCAGYRGWSSSAELPRRCRLRTTGYGLRATR